MTSAKSAGIKSKALQDNCKKISALFDKLEVANAKLEEAITKGTTKSRISAMDAVRSIADALELEVDDDLWPMPKYSELLFIY